MSRKIEFSSNAWKEYQYWQKIDKKLLTKIHRLIDEISRTPFEGSGKPEPLRESLSGLWSRRINDEHRLVYSATDDTAHIFSCRYHYQKN
jgi:toxin YoeB